MKKLVITLLMGLLPILIRAENFNDLKQKLQSATAQSQRLFNYPLNISLYSGKAAEEDVLVILHGYDSNHTLAEVLQNIMIYLTI